jgi:light-regulated signal transduction histidine kinase (bacteriophytochrome)
MPDETHEGVTKREVARRADDTELLTYDVIQELRMPMRGMSGFAQALLEEHRDKLAGDGVAALEEIRDNAKRVSRLLDGLLALSRVMRSDLVVERVDLGAIARGIAAHCAVNEPDRVVRLDVADDLTTTGDARLLSTLLGTLLENAWKFTRRNADPIVEVGVVSRAGVRTFFVRDNGVGFDMAKAERLFAPFQRLHAESEFPGTGIGLATAHRIVKRHGGTIWTEAKPGDGATFYFTLG